MLKLVALILNYMAVWVRLLAPGGLRAVAAENILLHRWKANLGILDIDESKSVPHVPTSHPFIERFIGTVRCELLNQTLFWNANDLQNKLNLFQRYYNEKRCHHGINEVTPLQKADKQPSNVISMEHHRWQKHCHGLFQLPMAA
ncbi:MAG: integrase core domain-containing protein [Legionellales bacterium]